MPTPPNDRILTARQDAKDRRQQEKIKKIAGDPNAEARRARKRVWTAGALTALVMGGIFHNQVLELGKDAIQKIEYTYNVWTQTPDNSPAFRSGEDSLAAQVAAKRVANIYDEKLFITYDKDAEAATRGPLYTQMETLARTLGREREFTRYANDMQTQWVGFPAGAGGIYTEKYNPEGKLSTYGDSLIPTAVTFLDQRTQEFITSLRSADNFDTELARQPELAAFVNTQGERTELLNTSTNHGNIASAYRAITGTAAGRSLANILPRDGNTPSPAVILMQSVMDEINALDVHAQLSTTGMTAQFSLGLSTPAQMCTIANAYYDADGSMRMSPAYAKAVSNVQKREDAKPGGGVRVQAMLDTRRDNAMGAGRVVQSQLGSNTCQAPSKAPA